MPQLQLPMFPHGTTEINDNLAFKNESGQITYIYGHLPVFIHGANDTRSFKMYISQLYVNGSATQAEISRAFGVTLITVKRAVKLYREKGPAGFFEEANKRGAAVLTDSVLQHCQDLLDEGKMVTDIAQETGLKRDTLRKAISSGRLRKKKRKILPHR